MFENSLDAMDLCRICLVTERVDIQIFEVEGEEGEFSQILTKINVCLPIKVAKDDPLPKKICVDCLCKLESFYQFYNISAQAEQQLLTWFVAGSPKKPETQSQALTNDVKSEAVEEIAAVDCLTVKPHFLECEDDNDDFFADGYAYGMSDDEDWKDEEEEPEAQRVADSEANKTTEESDKQTTKLRKKKPKKKKVRQHPNTLNDKVFCKQIGPGEYACTECGENFMQKKAVRAHFLSAHLLTDRFKCEYCGKEFARLNTFKLHRMMHGAPNNHKVFGCDKCNFKTADRTVLENHKQRLHTEKTLFECDHCGKKYNLKSDLALHMGRHDKTEHMCDICGKIVTNKLSLYQHQRTKHVAVPRFKCPTCKFKGTSQENLEKHIQRNHDPNNPFICQVCGHVFKVKSYLVNHVKRYHENAEKKYLCSICGKSFFENAHYMKHYLIHFKIRPYECNVCRESFTQRVTMMAHWRKQHPDATEPPPVFPLTEFFKNLQEQNSSMFDTSIESQSNSSNVTFD